MKETQHLLKLWKETSPTLREGDKGYSLKLVEKIANVFSMGMYYYYVFNYFDLKIDFVHPNVQQILGVIPEDFTIDRYLDSIHPNDVTPTHWKEKVAARFLLEEIPPEKIPHFKISYSTRVRTSKGDYKMMLHQTIPLAVTEDRKIGYVLSIHTDISHMEVPHDHKISFIALNGGPSWYRLDPENPDFFIEDFSLLFSNREREILSMLSRGRGSEEIADELHISPATVRTHRKNILAKTHCKNTTELITKCIKAGVI